MIKNYPIIKITLLFSLGILLEKLFSLSIISVFFVFMFFAVLTVYSIFKNREDYQKRFMPNIFIVLLIVLSGMLHLSNHKNVELPGFINYKIQPDKIFGTVESIELPKGNNIEFIGKIDSIKYHDQIELIGEKFLIKSSAKNKYTSLKKIIDIGDSFILTGYIQKARNKRNPGEFDYRNYLIENDIYGIIYYKEIKFIDTRDFYFMNIIKNVRFALYDQIYKLYSKENAALISGLMLAYRKNMDHDLIEKFINSGVVHVLAVSGLHVGFITFIFLFLFSRFNIYLKYSLTILGLICFVLLTNVQPSVMRASIMAVSVIIGLFFSRKYNSYNSIAIAAFFILLINPRDLFNPGFQLSFSAVLSIITFYPLTRQQIEKINFNKFHKNIFLFVSVSLSAQVGTLPFTLLYFHKLSFIALFANLLVIPMIGFIVGLSIVSVGVSFLWLYLGHLFANTNNLIIDAMFMIVKNLGDPKYSVINISKFSFYDFIVFYLIMAAMSMFLWKFKNLKARLIIILLLIANFFVWEKMDNLNFNSPNELKLMMIDVGQGDSFLIGFPDGKIALIDAGLKNKNFDTGQRVIHSLLNYLDIEQIDYAFVSHVDNDHYGGFSYLIHNDSIAKIYKPELNASKNQDVIFENEISEAKIDLMHYNAGIIKGINYRIYILNNKQFYANSSKGENDKSGIIKIQYGNTSFLFVGDAGFLLENELVHHYKGFLKSDVLKVGHHGSKHSSSAEFINLVKPTYSLISVGEFNTFKHPSKDVIAILRKCNSKIMRTDLMGCVTLVSDGTKIYSKQVE